MNKLIAFEYYKFRNDCKLHLVEADNNNIALSSKSFCNRIALGDFMNLRCYRYSDQLKGLICQKCLQKAQEKGLI